MKKNEKVPPKLWYFLNEDKNVVPFTGTYAELEEMLGEGANKRVREDDVGEYWVSTVFLHVDYPGDMFFETMVFGHKEDGEIDFREQYCDRYRTWDEAVEGHNRTVEALKRGELDLYGHENDDAEDDLSKLSEGS